MIPGQHIASKRMWPQMHHAPGVKSNGVSIPGICRGANVGYLAQSTRSRHGTAACGEAFACMQPAWGSSVPAHGIPSRGRQNKAGQHSAALYTSRWHCPESLCGRQPGKPLLALNHDTTSTVRKGSRPFPKCSTPPIEGSERHQLFSASDSCSGLCRSMLVNGTPPKAF